jgi:hypothetical protein
MTSETHPRQTNPYLLGAGIGLASMAVAIFGGYACGAQNEQKLNQRVAVAYASCADVEAAGKAPLHRGDPGYSAKLDRDGDGTACDQAGGTDTAALRVDGLNGAECQAFAEKQTRLNPGSSWTSRMDGTTCVVSAD